jgi:hypothetical protein
VVGVAALFQTGGLAPETGLYKVIHKAHKLPLQVVVRKYDPFPRCAECNDPVEFDLIYVAPDLYLEPGHCIHELHAAAHDIQDSAQFSESRSTPPIKCES